MDKKISTGFALAVIILITGIFGFILWLGDKQDDGAANGIVSPNQKACTEEAKICPDGSAVGRTGPNCEFAACPVDKVVGDSLIYKNTDYGFQVTLPKGWEKYQVSIQWDKGDDKHTYIYFMLPTADKSWIGSFDKNTGKAIPGMVDIFVITANDLATWNKDLNSTECKENPNPSCPYEGNVVAKNNKYVFDAGYGNGLLPPDVEKFRSAKSAQEFLTGKFKLLP